MGDILAVSKIESEFLNFLISEEGTQPGSLPLVLPIYKVCFYFFYPQNRRGICSVMEILIRI